MINFGDRLFAAVREKKTPAMVGIDPRWEALPEEVRKSAVDRFGDGLSAMAEAYREFSLAVVEEVADLAPIVKFQMAFFEELGPAGLKALLEGVMHAKSHGLLVVLDGKRNDIGSTAESYARGYLGETFAWDVDAMTVNPYAGRESLEPFVRSAKEHQAGVFVLVRTSNPGAGELQDLRVADRTVCEVVADWVEQWAKESVGELDYGLVGAVVGATTPDELAELRRRMPNAPILVPGYGAQGGSASDASGAFDDRGLGAVVNSSRGVIFAFSRPEYRHLDWRGTIRLACKDMIDDLARHTPAGRLRD